ncbi:uncharacterized protein LOC114075560 [Solanum pennellii]|uniref:Uncharacterized protein LOC114075560 n=1 Tax=Solanum pennellii TaxID=28526 RepID=A0ABM1V1U8_SOLPN|nr:uncharacterized protein LOC114075560 [Solanum pennellii]
MDFSDQDAPYPCLEIIENKQHARAKVLTLKVHPAVIGVFPLIRKMLDTSHHLPEWLSTETKDVTDNFSGKAFCENWRPPTNTVSTFIGELSISLWDLRTIGGLPVHGSFYNEVVPSAKELTHENAPFVELGVEESFRDETYMAAFLVCWLCKFVFPSKKADCIRASVLKVASLMAHGEIFSLAVPVLASIYAALRIYLLLQTQTLLRRSTHIILRSPKRDDVSLSTKGEQLQEKLSQPLKSKATPNIPPQSVRVVSKSKSLKSKTTHVGKEGEDPLQTPKAVNLADKEVINVTLKRKKPFSSSNEGVVKSLGIAPSYSNTSKTSISLQEIDICISAASSSNESNVSQELHWKRLKKKPKDLNTQQCEFAELDSICIDTAIFEDGAAGSTMPLKELAQQLGLGDIPSDVDVFEDCITSSTFLNVVKSSHPPLVEVKSEAANEIQPTKPMVLFSENVETFQNISTNVEVVETSQIGCPNVSKDLVCPLLATASNFESPKIISGFKLSYVSGMWRTLCECITQFSFESSENLKELEIGFASILNGLREVDFINLNPLEVLLEDFLKKHRDYDVARLSTSQ